MLGNGGNWLVERKDEKYGWELLRAELFSWSLGSSLSYSPFPWERREAT